MGDSVVLESGIHRNQQAMTDLDSDKCVGLGEEREEIYIH